MNYLERDAYGMYRRIRSNMSQSDNHKDKGPGPELMGADTLLGNGVHNELNENLGDIKEIMLDMRTGKVAYAVLSFGGFIGLGEKLFAVPWSALKLDTQRKCFMLNVEKSSLKNAPGFDPDDWPDMADPKWASGIHEYYGTKPNGSNGARL